jgi:hypothetical protein
VAAWSDPHRWLLETMALEHRVERDGGGVRGAGDPGHLVMPNGSLVATTDYAVSTALARAVVEAWGVVSH